MWKRRLRKTLVDAFSPVLVAQRWGRLIVKGLALLGSMGVLTIPSLSLPWRLALALSVLLCLAIWSCYQLQGRLESPDLLLVIDQSSRVTLTTSANAKGADALYHI